MQQRHERLLRLARFLHTTTKFARARIGALARADIRMEQQQQDLLGALERPGPCQSLLASAIVRRTEGLARERTALASEIAVENERLRRSEMRSRTAQRAIDDLRAALNDMQQRQGLETLGVELAQASASRKAPGGRS